jgi:hypothetical protein
VHCNVGDFHYAYPICIMDIEFDPDKAAENLRKHRVSFAHAEQALRDPAGVTVEGGGRASYPLVRPARQRL